MKWIGQHVWDLTSKFRQKIHVDNTNRDTDIEISKISGQPTLELSAWSATATAAHAGRIKFLKSGTATKDTFTAGDHTTAGEILGRIEAYGVDDSDGETLSSYIEFANDAISDADSSPGKIVFATSDADDAGVPTERLSIDDGGNIAMTGGNFIQTSTGFGAIVAETTKASSADTSDTGNNSGGRLALRCNDGAAMGNGHRLGTIEFRGAEDSSDNITIGARIDATCDAAWSASENGASLKFYTTDGNASQSLVLTLDSDKLATFAGAMSIAGNLTFDSVALTGIQTSAESFVDNDISLMTSAAIDDRINTAVTAEDLDLTADSGTAAVDLNSQALSVEGGTGITTEAENQTITINVDAAQSGITSLGTLTGLVLDGDKNITPGDGAMIHVDRSTITDSNTSGSGTAARYSHVALETPTLAATNSSVTTTDAATLWIQGAPSAGTNQTLTNAYALWVDAGATRLDGDLNITSGDMTLYDATNDGNPTFSIGSSATERLEIKAEYESGAQGLDVVRFTSFTAGSSADDSRFVFEVDDAFLFSILDDGLLIKASGNLEIGSGNEILSDSSGTTTLKNVDAVDATTAATIRRKDYFFKGYCLGISSGNFQFAEDMGDPQFPFQLNSDYGDTVIANGSLDDVSDWFRSSGVVVPRACTAIDMVGWASCAGTGEVTISLCKITPDRNSNAAEVPIVVATTTFTALNSNDKLEDFSVGDSGGDGAVTIVTAAIAAGDILMPFVLSPNTKTTFFNMTLEVKG